jgi:replicative DNA helicase
MKPTTAQQMIVESTIPQNIEAEEAVLGAVMIDPEAIYRVMPILSQDDFYLQKHSWVYQAIRTVAERGSVLNYLAINEELRRVDCGQQDGKSVSRLDLIGGPAYIAQLVSSVPSALFAESYANMVKEAKQRRKLLDVASSIAKDAYNLEIPADEAIAQAVSALQDSGRGGSIVSSASLADELLAEAEEYMVHPLQKGSARYLDTGFPDLNDALGGWDSGFYVILGAPHMGKTWMLIHAAAKVALRGTRALVFSLEMKPKSLVRRLALAHADLNAQQYARGLATAEQLRKFNEYVRIISAAPLDIYAETRNAGEIVATIHRECRINKPGIVCIDYLGIMETASAENETYRQMILTRQLKGVAQILDIPLLTAHQISDKEIQKRGDKHPTAADGFGSSGAQQDADVMLGLYRDEVYNKGSELQNVLEIGILKNRLNGGASSSSDVPMFFNGHTGRMESIDRSTLPGRR